MNQIIRSIRRAVNNPQRRMPNTRQIGRAEQERSWSSRADNDTFDSGKQVAPQANWLLMPTLRNGSDLHIQPPLQIDQPPAEFSQGDDTPGSIGLQERLVACG